MLFRASSSLAGRTKIYMRLLRIWTHRSGSREGGGIDSDSEICRIPSFQGRYYWVGLIIRLGGRLFRRHSLIISQFHPILSSMVAGKSRSTPWAQFERCQPRTRCRKNCAAAYMKVGAISSLLVQYHCRSSVGRWSYGAATAAMVGAISLVLCVVILVVTTVPPKIQSAPPPIEVICTVLYVWPEFTTPKLKANSPRLLVD